MGNVDITTLQRIKNHPESIEVFLKHTPQAKIIIGEHANIWMKNYDARILYKNQNWSGLEQLFGKSIGTPKTFSSLPNQRWIDDGDADFNESVATLISDIINDNTDINKIATNLGVSEGIVMIAKRNYFERERLILVELNGSIGFQKGRFTKTNDILNYDSDLLEWDNATKNIFANKQNFKNFIAHEYIESKLIDEYGVSYRSLGLLNTVEPYTYGAHDLAPTINNNSYADAGRVTQSPRINDNLSNLDDIVNWLAGFYKF